MDIYSLLLMMHLVGTVLAVGGATMIEVQLNYALANGMSADHRGILGLNFVVLRIGLVLALFTGFGFVAYFVTYGGAARLQDPIIWMKLFLVLIVAVNALLLQTRKIGLYWGSAISFVTWWFIMFLGMGLVSGVAVSFLSGMALYAGAVVCGAYVLHKLREFIKSKHV